ncbi:MAG: DoxX family membrane protein [Actinomycetaceae bacterium]
MSLNSVIARPLLAAPFIADGLDAALKPKRHVDKVERIKPTLAKIGVPSVVTDSPELLTRALGAVTTLSAVGLALGKKPRTAALTLAVVSVPTMLARNPIWTAQSKVERKEMTGRLLGSAGLLGGLLTASGDRGGRPSLAWRARNGLDQRRALREQKAALKESLAS